MKGVLKMEKDPVDSFLEEIFEARIKERLEKATAEVTRKGMEEGRVEGRKEGRKEGREEGFKIGEEKGIKIGEERGKEEEIEQVVKKMVANGLDDEIVSRVTGLTLREVRKLKS